MINFGNATIRRIKKNYEEYMEKEHELFKLEQPDKRWTIPSSDDMYGISARVHEAARLSRVPRGYLKSYGQSQESEIYESVGSHTYLATTIANEALLYYHAHGIDIFSESDCNYSHVITAILRHDLPENESGDQIDDGDRNEAKKRNFEQNYQEQLKKFAPSYGKHFESIVLKLLQEMERKSSSVGRLLFCTDKIAAPIGVLLDDLDSNTHRPAMREINDPINSERDRQEIKFCGTRTSIGEKSYCLASEMWTIDFLKLRKLFTYDDVGFFTALLIMSTLQTQRHWYAWRIKDYQD